MIGLEACDTRSRAACGDERYEPIKALSAVLAVLAVFWRMTAYR
jgi:hypothetical protein